MNQHHSALSEILEITLYTKPKLATIRPKIEFSQAKWLYHSALGEILGEKNEKKYFFRKEIFFEW